MKYNMAQRKKLGKGSFAVPSKAPESGSYPIPDEGHARDALARSSGKPVQGQVARAVHKKFPNMQVSALHRMAGQEEFSRQ